MKIHALFSLWNNYDQPPNCLECFWPEKPTLEEVAQALGRKFPAADDEETLVLVKIWQGENVRATWEDTNFWVEQIESGKRIGNQKGKR